MIELMIKLLDSQPEIWRDVAVPDHYTFHDLHEVIQKAMGWSDLHLHEFVLRYKGREWLISEFSEDVLEDFDILDERDTRVGDWLGSRVKRVLYIYDFGDEWVHSVEYVSRLNDDSPKPILLGGFGACPPEDVGGMMEYLRLLEALKDERDEYHNLALEILGEDFDPEYFDPSSVRF